MRRGTSAEDEGVKGAVGGARAGNTRDCPFAECKGVFGIEKDSVNGLQYTIRREERWVMGLLDGGKRACAQSRSSSQAANTRATQRNLNAPDHHRAAETSPEEGLPRAETDGMHAQSSCAEQSLLFTHTTSSTLYAPCVELLYRTIESSVCSSISSSRQRALPSAPT